jgi:hypothetical protein
LRYQLARCFRLKLLRVKLFYDGSLARNAFLCLHDPVFGSREMFLPERSVGNLKHWDNQKLPSSIRFAAGLAGFLILSHMRERPGW